MIRLFLLTLLLGAQTATLTPNEKDFIEFAGEFNLTLIRLGQMAQEEAASTKVKEFGRMMQQEHQANLETLAALAQKDGGVTPQTLDSVHVGEVKHLQEASGPTFDREFLKAVVNDHETALTAFRREASSGISKNLKSYAAAALPVLQQHVKQAKALSASSK